MYQTSNILHCKFISTVPLHGKSITMNATSLVQQYPTRFTIFRWRILVRILSMDQKILLLSLKHLTKTGVSWSNPWYTLMLSSSLIIFSSEKPFVIASISSQEKQRGKSLLQDRGYQQGLWGGIWFADSSLSWKSVIHSTSPRRKSGASQFLLELSFGGIKVARSFPLTNATLLLTWPYIKTLSFLKWLKPIRRE